MNVKKIVIITCGILVFVLAIACVAYKILIGKPKPDGPNPTTTTKNNSSYSEFDSVTKVYSNVNDFSANYKEYKELNLSNYSDDYDATAFDKYNYAVITYTLLGCNEHENNVKYETIDNTLYVYFDIRRTCGLCAPEHMLIYKKVDKNIKEVKTLYRNINTPDCDYTVSYKPLIYIYPTEDMDLTVKLGNTHLLTHTYPLYKDAWNVHVSKDGNIYDYDTERNYYGLYWEAYDTFKPDMKTGYVVEGKDTIKLLEEKLEVLGLNEREINEFIIYWIDKLENNKYNYLYFRTTEEVNKSMPLEFSKDPDTLIRVLVDIVPLDEKIEVKEQELTPVIRTGYTVVEWGGNIHKNI